MFVDVEDGNELCWSSAWRERRLKLRDSTVWQRRSAGRSSATAARSSPTKPAKANTSSCRSTTTEEPSSWWVAAASSHSHRLNQHLFLGQVTLQGSHQLQLWSAEVETWHLSGWVTLSTAKQASYTLVWPAEAHVWFDVVWPAAGCSPSSLYMILCYRTRRMTCTRETSAHQLWRITSTRPSYPKSCRSAGGFTLWPRQYNW